MTLTEAERGMLQTKMADDVLASIFGWSVKKVRQARDFLAVERAADLKRWNSLGGEVLQKPCKKTVPKSAITQNPARTASKPAPLAQEFSQGQTEVEPKQIDLEEIIAATEIDARHGAPAGLAGRALASWLVDNTALTFAGIAELAKIDLDEVELIADGEIIPLIEEDEAYAPRPELVIFGASSPSRSAPPPAAAQPKKRGQPKAMILRSRNMGKTAATAAASAPPPKIAAPQISTMAPPPMGLAIVPKRKEPDPVELPPRVIRWCRWFLDAKWRLTEVAELFDLQPRDLRAALGLDTEAQPRQVSTR